jgi:lipopolysaccharide biosynthesis protein
MRKRLVAFYLPQFHPIPENDKWWGLGFTEWTNVAKAKPLFDGHYQPQIPADLGFYDLRIPEVREAQAALAKEYGIFGFCYYHYWFNGKRLLERPFEEVLTSGKPDFPFCLCWANENWTRTWDGGDQTVLIEQRYSDEDDINHIRSLIPAFRDARYIRIDNKPVFLLYRASSLPDVKRTTSIWREEAWKSGTGEIYLCKVESMTQERCDPTTEGFDAAVEFQPDVQRFGPPLHRGALRRITNKLGLSNGVYASHYVYEYAQLMRNMLSRHPAPYKRFPGIFPAWDNSARRATQGAIIKNSIPDLYEEWLTTLLRNFEPPTPDENLVFITAWNEWAEGNHLEPCQRWGRGYLEATRNAVRAAENGTKISSS